MDSNIGKRLDGRYELLELIGVGGMADIYKARDLVEDKIVAAKILKNELAESEDFLRRFRNESKAIALLSHPNIVKIFDVGFDKVQFIVMEYIDGITLTEYIERQGILKWRDVLHFITQILRALQHAHDRGIVHRDIKSQNVMLLTDGTIKVMDFGIARFNRETDKTISEKAIGSVHYISPEQAKGEATDEKSDIYSVGVMLYEMLTGRKPFDGENPVSIALMHMQTQPKKPAEINSSIPDGLEEITLKAMQKEPIKRYQTAGEMINDIDEFKKNPSIVFEYKYFSSEQNPKYFEKTPGNSGEITPLKNQPQKVERNGLYDDDDEDDEDDDYYDEIVERRSPLLSILFATASVFVIMAAWLIFQIVTGTFGKMSDDAGQEVRMPNLMHQDIDEVRLLYPFLNLRVEQDYSSEHARNIIIYQSVPVNRIIRSNQFIDVTISMGPQLVELDNYTMTHIDEVSRRIDNRGLNMSLMYDVDETVPQGFVIRTDPVPGTMVEFGKTIVVVVSLGSGGGEMTQVPDLFNRNLTRAQAEERAAMYQVTLVFLEEYNTEVGIDRVISQDPAPMTQVERWSIVEVTISLGPRPEREGEILYAINEGRTGDYIVEHYIDGFLQEELTKIQNIELNREIRWNFEGEGIQKYAMYFTSVATGRRAMFVEYEFDFTGYEVKKTLLHVNNRIFNELSRPLEPAPCNHDERTAADCSICEECGEAGLSAACSSLNPCGFHSPSSSNDSGNNEE